MTEFRVRPLTATVKHILSNRQYTGCTVNFKTTLVSYKVHKTVHNPEEEWQIIPNTQEIIKNEFGVSYKVIIEQNGNNIIEMSNDYKSRLENIDRQIHTAQER